MAVRIPQGPLVSLVAVAMLAALAAARPDASSATLPVPATTGPAASPAAPGGDRDAAENRPYHHQDDHENGFWHRVHEAELKVKAELHELKEEAEAKFKVAEACTKKQLQKLSDDDAVGHTLKDCMSSAAGSLKTFGECAGKKALVGMDVATKQIAACIKSTSPAPALRAPAVRTPAVTTPTATAPTATAPTETKPAVTTPAATAPAAATTSA